MHLVILKAGLSLCLMSVHSHALLLAPPPGQAYLPLFYTEQTICEPALRPKQDGCGDMDEVFERAGFQSLNVWPYLPSV